MKGSDASRRKIFEELDKAELSGSLPIPAVPEPTIRSMNSERKLKKLEDLLKENRAEVFHVETKDLNRKISEILAGKEIEKVSMSAGAEALLSRPKPAKGKELEVHVFHNDFPREKESVFAAGASISEARWGIAETGSLAVLSSPENPRSLSLAAPFHICLLNRANIAPDLETLLAKEAKTLAGSANLALISGPSRTADIEFNISFGIHGPKELTLIVHG